MTPTNETENCSPEAQYQTPGALAKNGDLSRAEKVETLKDWSQTVQRRLDSAAEGMVAETTRKTVVDGKADALEKDAELLREIDLEIERLESSST